jgi:hypothetical protein
MNYQKRFYPDKLADPYVKHDVTYLIFAPAPEDKPYLNGDDWKWNDVKIASDPVSVTAYPNGYRVEEYRLTEEEIAIPSNPLMIRGLSFR